MRIPILLIFAGLAMTSAVAARPSPCAQDSADWPQGAGPNGNWSAEGPAPPLEFSVRSGQGILWRAPLPETGQGGIAVVGDRVFVACMRPWSAEDALSPEEAALYSHAIEKRSVAGKHIVALCLDRATGKQLWSRPLAGEVPAIYTYPFSDGTSASPVADGEHVWFTNACGVVACFTHDGEAVWERRYTPTFDGPFNKQFEPFLVRDESTVPARKVLVHMEPVPAPSVEGEAAADEMENRWHVLLGLDAASGEVLWRSEDALTHYNAPTLMQTAAGPAVLHARGGPHKVPERPVGISLTAVTGEAAGRALWRYEESRSKVEGSLQTMAYDERFVYWLLGKPHGVLVVLDRTTGEVKREISLQKGVGQTAYDDEAGRLQTTEGVDLERPVMPARYSLIAANGHVFFQCYATAWGKPTLGAPYSFARIDPQSGDARYLEVPTDRLWRDDGKPEHLWRTPRTARPLNSAGIEVTGDDRCRWDGWDWVFNGSPTAVGERLYFTLACGVVYVLDAGEADFGPAALLAVNDLGPAGGVWTANSVSYAGGQLFHRTGAELICIGAR